MRVVVASDPIPEELQRLPSRMHATGLRRVQRQPLPLHHPLDHRPHRGLRYPPADYEVVRAIGDVRAKLPSRPGVYHPTMNRVV